MQINVVTYYMHFMSHIFTQTMNSDLQKHKKTNKKLFSIAGHLSVQCMTCCHMQLVG